MIVLIVMALAVVGVLYGLVPPARRFIKGDRPVWWVRDGLIAVLVAVLVLFGHSYVLSVSGTRETGEQGQSQAQRISDVNFVRFRSSEQYQPRPFRQFDLEGMNLSGLELRGADFTEAKLSGANLTRTVLSFESGTPGAPGRPAIPSANTFFQGANLCRADLTAADLRYAYLVNTNLTGADLAFARLDGAALNGSDLSGATLPSDPRDLAGIYYDDSTIWPEGFQPPPSATGDKMEFLEDPVNRKLYGDVQRPACNS